jgi:hypothetical protein
MAPAPLPPFVPVEEYLHAAYEHDMDYVDGVLEERDLGEIVIRIYNQSFWFSSASAAASGKSKPSSNNAFRSPRLAIACPTVRSARNLEKHSHRYRGSPALHRDPLTGRPSQSHPD